MQFHPQASSVQRAHPARGLSSLCVLACAPRPSGVDCVAEMLWALAVGSRRGSSASLLAAEELLFAIAELSTEATSFLRAWMRRYAHAAALPCLRAGCSRTQSV